MNTRRGFFARFGLVIGAVLTAPKLLLGRRQSKFFVPNPAWVNAPYEIVVWRPHDHIGTVVWHYIPDNERFDQAGK